MTISETTLLLRFIRLDRLCRRRGTEKPRCLARGPIADIPDDRTSRTLPLPQRALRSHPSSSNFSADGPAKEDRHTNPARLVPMNTFPETAGLRSHPYLLRSERGLFIARMPAPFLPEHDDAPHSGIRRERPVYAAQLFRACDVPWVAHRTAKLIPRIITPSMPPALLSTHSSALP